MQRYKPTGDSRSIVIYVYRGILNNAVVCYIRMAALINFLAYRFGERKANSDNAIKGIIVLAR